MAKETHLEELVAQIDGMAPFFGRAQKDILAIGTRARGGDYRGVLQNTRLVVETLLRAIYANKNQTPGKQTLEQLLNKLTKDLPTNIQVHTRTIQAWGNVGAHDHSDDLFGEGVEFSQEEALASLNSLLVILGWYRDNHLDGASLPSVPAAPAAPAATPSSPPPKKGGTGKFVAIGAVLVAGVVGFLLLGPGASKTDQVPENGAVDRAALDRAYTALRQSPPPASCQTKSPDLVVALEKAMTGLVGGRARGARAVDVRARSSLELLTKAHASSAELWGVLARARLFAGSEVASVLEATNQATSQCPEWAEPHNVKGNLHVLEEDLDAAQAAYLRATKLEPSYLAPRFNLGLLHLKSGEIEQALAELDVVLAQDPNFDVAYGARGRAKLLAQKTDAAIVDLEEATRRNPSDGPTAMVLGQAYRAKGDQAKAKVYFCQAKRLDVAAAGPLCPD